MIKELHENNFYMEAEKDCCIEVKDIKEAIKALSILGVNKEDVKIEAKIKIDFEHNKQISEREEHIISEYFLYGYGEYMPITLISSKKVKYENTEIKVNLDCCFIDFETNEHVNYYKSPITHLLLRW